MQSGSFKIELFEQKLQQTQSGRKLQVLIDLHFQEANKLINTNQQVKLNWHRNFGPAFVAQIMGKCHDEQHQLANNINGLSWEIFVQNVFDSFVEHGGTELKTKLQAYMRWIRKINSKGESLFDYLNIIFHFQNPD